MATLKQETDELNRRISRMEIRAAEKDKEQNSRDDKAKAMSSLLYRIVDKAQELDTNLDLLATSVVSDMEMTTNALERLTQKMNEVTESCGLENLKEMLDKRKQEMEIEDAMSSDEDETLASFSSYNSTKDKDDGTMPAAIDSLRGMGEE